jgi:hypothetical protein
MAAEPTVGAACQVTMSAMFGFGTGASARQDLGVAAQAERPALGPGDTVADDLISALDGRVLAPA